MPSEGRKYVTSWEREQDRIAGLSGEGFVEGEPDPTETPYGFAVSSLTNDTFLPGGEGRIPPMDSRGVEEEEEEEPMQPLDLRRVVEPNRESADRRQEFVEFKAMDFD